MPECVLRRTDHDFHVEAVAVAVDALEFGPLDVCAQQGRGATCLFDRRGRQPGDETAHRLPGQHRRIVSEQRRQPGIGGKETAVAADHQQRFRGRVEQRRELLPRVLAPAGVLGQGEETVDVAVRAALRLEEHVQFAPVRKRQRELLRLP